MDSMHVGRDDQQAERCVNAARQRDVAMVEHGRHGSERKADQDSEGRHTDGDDGGQHDGLRHERLAWMMAEGRSTVDVEIAVMDLMKSPQQRNGVGKPVLRIIGEIERDDANQQRQP